MKYIKIEEYPATVYYDKGLFFIDYDEIGSTAGTRLADEYPDGIKKPVHSYPTLTAAKQALYYHYN